MLPVAMTAKGIAIKYTQDGAAHEAWLTWVRPGLLTP